MTESFHTTRWTRVIAAKGDSAALSELCDTYYHPVHAYLRHTVHDVPEDQIRDLTHEFFAKLLKNPGLDYLEKGQGKFRSYLLGAVKHFLADWRKHENAGKRGGKQAETSLDTGEVEKAHRQESADEIYDRKWALEVLTGALDTLEKEFGAAQKLEQFKALRPWISGEPIDCPQSKVAVSLGMTEGAIKVAIHRLRKRFRECVLFEIRQTIPDEADPAEELDYLIRALS